MSAAELSILLEDTLIGRVHQDRQGRLKFTYDDAWRLDPGAYPLSLSMPLGASEHSHKTIEAFMRGLLPDNMAVLEGWGRQFQVSPRNAFALLSHVGEDCAGAVQFVHSDRVPASTPTSTSRHASIEWLDEDAIAERLKVVRDNPAASRLQGDAGQFSLAGAQPKTALILENGRWGVPSGRVPTTHILKPPTGHLAGFAENEHLCMELARRLEFPVAQSRVIHFGNEIAIVVERYDRVHSTHGWVRIHQEDLCQALGLDPNRKYQSEGGPDPKTIVSLLRSHSTAALDDVTTFVDALGLNWLIAGTDAHAKNYSLLIGPRRVRLAPLYDVASVLPYPQFDVNRIKLAMKVADRYRLHEIGKRQWLKAADSLAVDPSTLLERIARMADAIPDLTAEISREMVGAGLKSEVIDRLVVRLSARARLCLEQLS